MKPNSIQNSIRYRSKWIVLQRQQGSAIKSILLEAGYIIVSAAERSLAIKGKGSLKNAEIIIVSRVKKNTGIVNKMNRFGESLDKVLDIVGHRIIVANVKELESVLTVLKKIGTTPTKDEMLLRNGELQFPWLRDYRKKNHLGKSTLSASDYNEAVHMNRKIHGMICELQLVTYPLYVRAFVSRSGSSAHAQFARRRTEKYKKK